MSTEPSFRAGPPNQEWKLPESIESRYKIALTRWGIGCSINPCPPGSFLTSDGHRALFMWLAQLTEKELSIEPRPCSMSRISRLCALGGVRVSVRRLYPFQACPLPPSCLPHCKASIADTSKAARFTTHLLQEQPEYLPRCRMALPGVLPRGIYYSQKLLKI